MKTVGLPTALWSITYGAFAGWLLDASPLDTLAFQALTLLLLAGARALAERAAKHKAVATFARNSTRYDGE